MFNLNLSKTPCLGLIVAIMDKELIQKWVAEDLISQQQADRMLLDILDEKRERRSNKFIIVISTIGAVLLGTGAILFIASNWQVLSSIVKMLILIGTTGAAYAAGYYLKYQYGELPRVGGALMLLGALLFGATVMLTAQIYHVAANHHSLVLIWLIGILPLVYSIRTVPMAFLAAALLMLWVGLFIGNYGYPMLEGNMNLVYAASALALFGFGGLHYKLPGMDKVAHTFRIIALKILMVTLFLLTFRFFSRSNLDAFPEGSFGLTEVLASYLLAFVALLLNWFIRKEDKSVLLESLVGLGILLLLLIFYIFPSTTLVYVVLFNLLFLAVTLLLIYYGYSNGDIRIVNMGLFWLAVFLIAKYFDWFFMLLDRALFFLIGGVIFVAGGILLEKQRRQIKSRFGK